MSDFDIKKLPSQKGRVTVITGANTGLGFETAKAMAGTGIKVIMACRNLEKAMAAQRAILHRHPSADTEIMLIDMTRLDSVREFARSFIAKYNRLDILVNNAGIMIPPYSKTQEGFESQMGVNYLAHFLLTGLLLKTIVSTPGSRIVMLASNAHRRGEINFDDINWEKKYRPMEAYQQSKLACLIFAIELQKRFDVAGLKTLSVASHPGLSLTDLVRHIPAWLLFISKPLTSIVTHSPEKGALPTLYAALSDDVHGGEYFGPQGRGEWTGKPGRAKIFPQAFDQETARRLWDLSEKLTGIKFQF